MTTLAAPFGFELVGGFGGASRCAEARSYRIKSGHTTAIYMNELVRLVTPSGTPADDGWVDAITDTDATASGPVKDIILGVANGFRWTDASGKPTHSKHYPGSIVSADIECFVVDDPKAIFRVQAAQNFDARAAIGQRYAVTIPNPKGSTTTGVSKQSLAGTANAAYPIKVVDIPNIGAENPSASGYPIVHVMIAPDFHIWTR